jgi:hypothetical protein
MAYLYNSPDKNIFVNIGLGLWDSYNMATGLLGDILSYVRLFALGLSGGILASVFNSLAVGMSPDNVIAGPIVMVLIFVIGHAINIFMNVLGAMVHPMRLTFVEFFKNAGYEGGGKEYEQHPFRFPDEVGLRFTAARVVPVHDRHTVLAVLFPEGEGRLSARADPFAAHLFQPFRICLLAGNDKRQRRRHRRQQQD